MLIMVLAVVSGMMLMMSLLKVLNMLLVALQMIVQMMVLMLLVVARIVVVMLVAVFRFLGPIWDPQLKAPGNAADGQIATWARRTQTTCRCDSTLES